MNINDVLQYGREALLKNGINPREARLLLAFVMKIKNEDLIIYKECSNAQYEQYLEIIERRSLGEPYAYIVGHKEFMKLDFKVNSSVLIPREDTEILVQEIISIANKPKLKILDMCTGSGCIAISLAKFINDAEITAVDISEDALKVAKENAKINEVNINFIESNLFGNISEKFDIIVSNPPYIRKAIIETLQQEVKQEPIIALDGGESGLEFYEKIIKNAPNYLNNNGILAFEIGFDQGQAVSELMKKEGFKNIEIKKDFSQNDRIVIGKYDKINKIMN